jgi:hypothetical protein
MGERETATDDRMNQSHPTSSDVIEMATAKGHAVETIELLCKYTDKLLDQVKAHYHREIQRLREENTRLKRKGDRHEKAYDLIYSAMTSIGYSNPSLEEWLLQHGGSPGSFAWLRETNEFQYLRTLDVEIAEMALAQANAILQAINHATNLGGEALASIKEAQHAARDYSHTLGEGEGRGMGVSLLWRHKKAASVPNGSNSQVVGWLKATFGSFPVTLTSEHIDTLLVLDGIWRLEHGGDGKSPFLFLAQRLQEGGEIELTTAY